MSEVWPGALRGRPDACLVLAGSDPPASVTCLASRSVSVTGYLPSLEPQYAAAGVFAAPLRTGAGLKFKVAQALACGLPVVANERRRDGFAELGGHGVFGAVRE